MEEAAVTQLREACEQLALGSYVQMTQDILPFTGQTSDSIDSWLNKFAAITNMGIPNGTSARLLFLKLGDEARLFAEILPADTQADIELLKTALRNEYHGPLHVNAARAMLRSEKWRIDDSPAKLYNRLQPLILKIYSASTRQEKDLLLKQELWIRLPDNIVVLSTGHVFTTAASLRDFATELLETLKHRTLTTINTIKSKPTVDDSLKQSILDLSSRVQQIAIALQGDVNAQTAYNVCKKPNYRQGDCFANQNYDRFESNNYQYSKEGQNNQYNNNSQRNYCQQTDNDQYYKNSKTSTQKFQNNYDRQRSQSPKVRFHQINNDDHQINYISTFIAIGKVQQTRLQTDLGSCELKVEDTKKVLLPNYEPRHLKIKQSPRRKFSKSTSFCNFTYILYFFILLVKQINLFTDQIDCQTSLREIIITTPIQCETLLIDKKPINLGKIQLLKDFFIKYVSIGYLSSIKTRLTNLTALSHDRTKKLHNKKVLQVLKQINNKNTRLTSRLDNLQTNKTINT
jgi:hypothetical protein